MTWLIRLYPTRWRKRYDRELEQLVRDLRPDTSTVAITVDLVKGALDAHVQQGLDVQTSDRRAIKRGILIAGTIWLGLSAEILAANVVFPSKTDDDLIPVVISYLCIFAALFLTGMLAAGDGAGRKGQALAGLIAGSMIGVLTVATFAVVDNVWLDIVAQQQAKIDGFARSGAGSMREYINHGLVGPAVFLTIGLGVLGAALSLAGGLFGLEPTSQDPDARS
jgi:uncharacterized membrane protein